MGVKLYNVVVQYPEFLQRQFREGTNATFECFTTVAIWPSNEISRTPFSARPAILHHLVDEKLPHRVYMALHTIFRATFHNRNECFKAFYSGKKSNFSISGKEISTSYLFSVFLLEHYADQAFAVECLRTKNHVHVRRTFLNVSWDATHPPTPITRSGFLFCASGLIHWILSLVLFHGSIHEQNVCFIRIWR